MAEQDVEALRKARESFVRKRRVMAEQMAPAGDLQAAIEAIDRAIKDEEQLPPDYAQEEPVTASEASVAEGSNVVDVDFDPA